MSDLNEPLPFDFSTPGGLPGDVEGPLTEWCRRIGEAVPERWREQLATAPGLAFSKHDAVSPGNFSGSIPEQSVGVELKFDSDAPNCEFVFSRPFLLALLLEMLGDEVTEPPDDRSLSTLELSMCDLLFDSLAGAINDAWSEPVPVLCRAGSFDGRPERGPMAILDEGLLLSRFNATLTCGDFPVCLVFPRAALEEFFETVGHQATGSTEETRALLEARTRELPVQLVVRLGEAELPMGQLAMLQPGDMVMLKQRIDDPITAEISGRPSFEGWAGRVGIQQAFQIDATV